MVTSQASQVWPRPSQYAAASGLVPGHLWCSHSTSRVLLPGPHLFEHSPQPPTVHSQPLSSSQASFSYGFCQALSQSLSRPELHFTWRVRTPYPQEVEQTLQGPTNHLEASLWAFFARPIRSIPLGSGTTRFLSLTHSGACSHCMLHMGLGQSLGRLQVHWHTGSGHTVLQPMDPALEQSNSHLGSAQRVMHLGFWQSKVFVPLHRSSAGQNIAQLGSLHFSLHFEKAAGSVAFGHRVSHWGTPQAGLQFCSHTGWVHFQAQ
mmetsp:Transcript_36824/g.80480  ORF Transcript_36824/g.80480 Transcript_36824/m.80480 type:complete len:262 (-) Transcript_36824:486-1271(-)